MRLERGELAPQSKSFHNEELPEDISAWLHIGEDGIVTGFTGKAEIGQNIRTSLAQTIADELRVPFERCAVDYRGYITNALRRRNFRQPFHADHDAAIPRARLQPRAAC